MASWLKKVLWAALIAIMLPTIIAAASIKPEDAISNLSKWLDFLEHLDSPAWFFATAANIQSIFSVIGICLLFAAFVCSRLRKRNIIIIKAAYHVYFIAFFCLLGAVWYIFSDTTSVNGIFDETNATPQERMARKLLLDDATQAYLDSNPKADPQIFAGLKQAPVEYINSFFRSRGDYRPYVPRETKFSSEVSFYIECHIIPLPLEVSESHELYAMDVFPAPPVARGGAGLIQFSLSEAKHFDFGLRSPQVVQKCVITNFGNRTVVELEIGFYATWQEVLIEPDGSERGGSVTLQRPWRFNLSKLQPGDVGAFTFYIPNYKNLFVHLDIPTKIVGRFIDKQDRNQFLMSNNQPYGLIIDPNHSI